MIKKESKLDADQRIEVVSVLTPNFLHYPMAKKNYLKIILMLFVKNHLQLPIRKHLI
jgi:hypothetical protein